jgi:hypothetical protein
MGELPSVVTRIVASETSGVESVTVVWSSKRCARRLDPHGAARTGSIGPSCFQQPNRCSSSARLIVEHR